eukprot:1182855-Prorocentrum_minimum.AAC.2
MIGGRARGGSGTRSQILSEGGRGGSRGLLSEQKRAEDSRGLCTRNQRNMRIARRHWKRGDGDSTVDNGER